MSSPSSQMPTVTPDGQDQQAAAVERQHLERQRIQRYYDEVYHADASADTSIVGHYRRLAIRLGPWTGRRILDVACGTGVWLRATAALGAVPVGVDLSSVALNICRTALPQAELHCGPAERLPFSDRQFDFVSCLGALEHFIDPLNALREMVRVAKPDAQLLLLVPNADFLLLRLRLYGGTAQAAVREELRSLEAWQELFGLAGLRITQRWRDLHILSLNWITQSSWLLWPARLALAVMLPIWPLRWQYQVYHLCILKK